ncbi:MAG: hypothetical protein IPI46_01265 [Bacteroidetes bacterium]|nr:hypothetical protein [Bacteroidota bacterium]
MRSGLTPSTSTYWQVVTAPVLAGVPTGGALGCNPTLPTCSTGVTASNECGSVAVTCTPGTVVVNGCNNSQDFVYTATDACSGLTSTSTSTYTWQVVTAPVLAGVPTGGALGCNPTLPTCDAGVTASNECGSVAVTCTPGMVSVNGCNNSQDFVYTATDACSGLTSTSASTYTWTEVVTAPLLLVYQLRRSLGCNPTLPHVMQV